MRLPLYSLIGLGTIALVGVIVWIASIVSSLSLGLDFGGAWVVSSLLTGGRILGVAIVVAALVMNERLPLMIGWIVAAVNVLGSLLNTVVQAASGGVPVLHDILWMLGFAAAGAMALLLWIGSRSKAASTSNPWEQPQQAYANAVQQPTGWGQQQPSQTQQQPWGQPSAAAPGGRVSNPTQPVQPYPPQQGQQR